jgi:hypothetical protein
LTLLVVAYADYNQFFRFFAFIAVAKIMTVEPLRNYIISQVDLEVRKFATIFELQHFILFVTIVTI